MILDDLKIMSVKTLYFKRFLKNCRQKLMICVRKSYFGKTQNILESVKDCFNFSS